MGKTDLQNKLIWSEKHLEIHTQLLSQYTFSMKFLRSLVYVTGLGSAL